MNFRRTTWGVGLLATLAFSGCVGDDTPTPDGSEAGATTGAGGAGNDASVGTGGSAGTGGASTSDSGGDAPVACQQAAPMTLTSQNIAMCKASLAEAGADGGDDAGASCLICLCNHCPAEAMKCIGDSNCQSVNDCCRAACKCPTSAGGSDGAASEGGGSEASTIDGPAGDGAAE